MQYSVISSKLNSSWWVKSSNLNLKELGVDIGKCDSVLIREENDIIEFIKANKALVHPNIFANVPKGNNEDIRMALNQIHCGSLRDKPPELTEEHLEKSTRVQISKDVQKETRMTYETLNHQLQVIKEFLLSFKHLINPQVLQDAITVVTRQSLWHWG